MNLFYLVDGQTSVRHMLAETLAQKPGYEVVGQTGDGAVALEEIQKLRPNVVIMESRVPMLNGADLIRRLKRDLPETHFMIYSDEKSPLVVKEILKAGANGYIEKSVSLSELLNCVRIVSDGGCFFGYNITEVIRSVVSDQGGATSLNHGLTEREREVLVLIAEGGSNKEIAESLGLSVKTIDNHRCSMMRKLDLHNVAAITRFAIRRGLVNVDYDA